MTTTAVSHGRIALALHRLADGEDERRLLLLHGLGERTPVATPVWASVWPGPVWGLDFTGHGASTIPVGGGYTAEILMADVDVALAELGPSTIVGRGLGAYIALLIAGARPGLVRGAVLDDGPGLAGGGAFPGTPMILTGLQVDGLGPDEWALTELAYDVRPPDYATTFARQALQLSELDWPLVVGARSRPPWLEAVAAEPGVMDAPLADALALYAALA